MDTLEYPKEFLRGIASEEFIDNGLVLQSAFQFDDRGREDKMTEASINWLDDNGAVVLALNQKKDDGRLQFPAGLARLDFDKVKFILRSIPAEDFSYERAPLEGNRYHGNLLIQSNVKRMRKQMIISGIALSVKEIIPQEVH